MKGKQSTIAIFKSYYFSEIWLAIFPLRNLAGKRVFTPKTKKENRDFVKKQLYIFFILKLTNVVFMLWSLRDDI